MRSIERYEPGKMDKVMRMNSVTSSIENGFVFLPDKAPWLGEYLHELACFPKGRFDDQADSTSQALDWFKQRCATPVYGLFDYFKQEAARLEAENGKPPQPYRMTRADALREFDRQRWSFGRW
jgi:hypothetical protein